MTKKEAWIVFLMFALLIVLGIVIDSHQNGHFNAIKNFTDEDYLANFTTKVKEVGGAVFVSQTAYKADLAKIGNRLTKIEGKISQSSQITGPVLTVPQVTAVPAPTPTPTAVASKQQQSTAPVTVDQQAPPQAPTIVTVAPPSISDEKCCGELFQRLDQANQKLGQINERLKEFPDKKWLEDKLKDANSFNQPTPSSGNPIPNAPPPPVELLSPLRVPSLKIDSEPAPRQTAPIPLPADKIASQHHKETKGVIVGRAQGPTSLRRIFTGTMEWKLFPCGKRILCQKFLDVDEMNTVRGVHYQPIQQVARF